MADSYIVEKVPKRADDDLIYEFYFPWRLLADDPIVSAVITVTGDDAALLQGAPTVTADGYSVQVRLYEGTEGLVYNVECEATTNSGRVLVGDAKLQIVVP